MRIAHIDRAHVGLIFHKEETRDGLFLYWDNEDKKFYSGVSRPNMPMRPVTNEKYATAKNEKDARRLAAEFFAELGEDEE